MFTYFYIIIYIRNNALPVVIGYTIYLVQIILYVNSAMKRLDILASIKWTLLHRRSHKVGHFILTAQSTYQLGLIFYQ